MAQERRYQPDSSHYTGFYPLKCSNTDNMTHQLYEVLHNSASRVRYLVLDNGAYMEKPEARRMKINGYTEYCTCWKEAGLFLKRCVKMAITTNTILNIYLTNTPVNAPQYLQIGNEPNCQARNETLHEVKRIIESSPVGYATLAPTLNKVMDNISRSCNSRVTVIVVTNGHSTAYEDSRANDLDALQNLLDLNCVEIVARLCTNDCEILRRWNGFVLNIVVMPYYIIAVYSLRRFNPWIAYTDAMHSICEWGGADEVFNLIHKVELNVVQALHLIGIILGIDIDYRTFNTLNDCFNFIKVNVEFLKHVVTPNDNINNLICQYSFPVHLDKLKELLTQRKDKNLGVRIFFAIVVFIALYAILMRGGPIL